MSRIAGAFALASTVLGVAMLAGAAIAAEPAPPRSVLQPGASVAPQASAHRFIVRLNEPGGKALTGQDSEGDEHAYTAALRATQRAVLQSVFGSGPEAMQDQDRNLRLFDLVPMFAVNATPAEVKKLKSDPRVQSVQPDELSKPQLIDSLPLITVPGAYGLGAHGNGRAVAILDTGVNKTHEFLKGKVLAEACFNTTNSADGATSRCPGGAATSKAAGSGVDCNPAVIEGCGHGTHVAGIAAGNNTAISAGEPRNGVANQAKVLAVNVFSRFAAASGSCGSGATKDCLLSYTSDQLAALEYVRSLKRKLGATTIDSINMSIGGGITASPCNSDSRQPVIHALRQQGVATVISAGNDSYVDGVAYPACVSDAITVSASSKKAAGKPERIASYSDIATMVDVVAPGGDFNYPFNTSRDQIHSSYGAAYGWLAGTSMAAPHVTGAIAVIRSRAACKTKTVAQIETAFRTTGKAIKDWRIVSGVPQITKRRLDIVAAMNKLGCGT